MFASWDGNYLDITHHFISPQQIQNIIFDEVNRRRIGYINKDSQGNRIYTIHGKAVSLNAQAGGLGAKTGLYLFGCLSPDRAKTYQNGRRFSPGTKFYTLTATDRHGILADSKIRKLHPIECERLQTLPDGFTEGISDNQRYKALGNGWTVDVIVHLLESLLNK